jgi:poly-gamma-glutamate synthesis protein (capsule biosynthesis protein)
VIKLIIILQFALGNLFTQNKDTLRILFAGDIMQHKEQLASAAGRARGKSAIIYNYDDYYTYVKDLLGRPDFRVVNMETPFVPSGFSGYPAFGAPVSLLEASVRGGFNVFLTANNHICDKGAKGISYTIEQYEKSGIQYTGIATDSSSRSLNNPIILESKGFKIAIFNYTYGTNGIRTPSPFCVNRLDSVLIERDIKDASGKGYDILIAAVHWGSEYVLKHNSQQEEWKRLFNRLGVKYIIGSHPHVPQEIETEQDSNGVFKGITVYSLGNLISNMSAPYTRIGLAVTLSFVRINGRVQMLEPVTDFLWCARPGEILKNYTILPVKDFLDKPELFREK